MEKNKFSIILTSYNKPKLILDAIDSVVKQTYSNWELLVCDDNSNEETQKAIKNYLEKIKDDRIKFYQSNIQEQIRFQEVRYAVLANIGEKLTDGEFITYLADDDYLKQNKLQRCFEEFQECEWKTVVLGKQLMEVLDKDGKVIKSNIRDYKTEDKIILQPAYRVDHTSPVIKRFAVEESGGWDTHPSYWKLADAVFWCRLVNQGHWFYVIDEVLDVHRFNQWSVSAGVFDQQMGIR